MAAKKKTTKKKDLAVDCWCVTYSHRHGTDAWCTETEQGARNSIFYNILEWLSDMDDIDAERRVISLIEENKLGEVLSIWAEHTEEFFEYLPVMLPKGKDKELEKTLAKSLKEAKEHLNFD